MRAPAFSFKATLIWLFAALSLSAANAVEIDLPKNECSFAGAFVQTKALPALPKPVLSKGVFYYHCQHGVIWSTTEPTAEALVLNKSGHGATVTGNQIKPLKSRQGKFLSSLLNNLMAGNTQALQKKFVIEQPDENNRAYTLTPKKRSLKRGVKQIAVSIPDDANLDSSQIEIVILDRNAQTTEIRSQRTQVFDAAEPALNACQAAILTLTKACGQLIER